eukprot:gene61782-biopygen27670
MIHAPEDIMCYAVQGDRPMWKNTNVTAKEIRQVFRLSPCLICVLAKKRKEDSWNRALKHWIKVHNDLPRSADRYSPNAIIDNMHQVDARYQYRFAYGDIVCYPLTEKERRWKFDTKNELGFYLGDKKGMKGGCHVYQPYWHKILTRGDVHRIRISEFELMEWYGKRAHVRQSGLSWGLVEEAMLDLLKDKPYMHASAPRPATEDPEQDSDDSAGEDDGSGDMEQQEQPPEPEHAEQQPNVWHHNPNTIVLPVETRPIEELRAGARRTSTRERKRPASFIEESYQDGETVWEEDGELVRGIHVIEQLNAHMETDDNDNEARIASIYRTLTIHDPEILSVPEEDEENISTHAEKFEVAIRKEVTDLIETTGTLTPLSRQE